MMNEYILCAFTRDATTTAEVEKNCDCQFECFESVTLHSMQNTIWCVYGNDEVYLYSGWWNMKRENAN